MGEYNMLHPCKGTLFDKKKKNEKLIYAATWINVENTMPSERSQA